MNDVQMPSGIKRWIEIDLDVLAGNANEVRRHLPPGCKLMAVVKANAYGIGSVRAARALSPVVDMLAVTTLEEALELRRHDIAIPVLVLQTAEAADLPAYSRYDIRPAVDSLETLLGFELLERPLPFHLVVNTGMNRLGAAPVMIPELLAAAREIPQARIEGIFSHVASAANKNKTAAYAQVALFRKLLRQLEAAGLSYGLAHIANSATLGAIPDSCFDMVRVGTLIYGQSPVPLKDGWQIKTPWRAKARVISVMQVPRGQRIGYAGEYLTKRPLIAATVAIGYADGFALEPQSRPQSFGYALREFFVAVARIIFRKPRHYMVFNGRKLRLLGRISMQLATVDATGSGLKAGDTVEFSLRRTSAAPGLCRIYTENGTLAAIESLSGNMLSTVKESESASD